MSRLAYLLASSLLTIAVALATYLAAVLLMSGEAVLGIATAAAVVTVSVAARKDLGPFWFWLRSGRWKAEDEDPPL